MSVSRTPPSVGPLARSVRAWLGLPSDAGDLPTLPPALAAAFGRDLDRPEPERDRWGNWEPPRPEGGEADGFAAAPLDRWARGERERLLAEGAPLAPLWPDGRRYAVCLTHDVDRLGAEDGLAERTRNAARFLFARDAGELGSLDRLRGAAAAVRGLPGGTRTPDTAKTLAAVLDLEARRGHHSSFFFFYPSEGAHSVYDPLYRPHDACLFRGAARTVSEVMRAVAAEGHDVGLHGSFLSGADAALLRREAEAARTGTGLDIKTTRQHYLRWTNATPARQAGAGFLADGTLGFNFRGGFRNATGLPFFLPAEGTPGAPLLEVPLVLQDTALLPRRGGEETLRAAVSRAEGLFAECERNGSLLTLSFHPDRFHDPRFESLYGWCLSRAASGRAWTASLRAVRDWWVGRAARLEAA